MDQQLVAFINALRKNGVTVATSETLDAARAVDLVGYGDRRRLKSALGLTLAKSESELARFEQCFDAFFQFNDLSDIKPHAAKPDHQPAPRQRAEGPADERAEGPADAAPTEAGPTQATSRLGQMLLTGDRQALANAMAQAASAAGVSDIKVITQKGLYGRRMLLAMGLEALEQEMWQAEADSDPARQQRGRALRESLAQLRQEVKQYVERQYLLHARGDSRALREAVMRETPLANLHEFKDVQGLVRKLAKRLETTHSRRRRVRQRGKLDVRSTLRHNIPHDGVLLETHWKSQRVDRPRVMAICDVSGSVSQYARFLLMFLYSLTEVIPKVRAFAFSSDLGEVTHWFEQEPLERALELTLHHLGGGATDYGRSLTTFCEHCLEQVDHRTSVIILGDARNNHGAPRTDLLQKIHGRARRVIWLNPEPRRRWGSGDSEMLRYQAHCSWAEPCQSLKQLERFISNLLRYSQ
ncbi:MAG: hypothetical protein CML06_11055 [Pseudomonadales bacterium]|nr:hypothetical protein [Pseudomonadales bacterium]